MISFCQITSTRSDLTNRSRLRAQGLKTQTKQLKSHNYSFIFFPLLFRVTWGSCFLRTRELTSKYINERDSHQFHSLFLAWAKKLFYFTLSFFFFFKPYSLMFSFGFMSHHLLRFNGAVKVACLLFKPYVFCSLNSGLPLLWGSVNYS